MEKRKICAFTGHRQIKSAHEHKLSDLLSRAVKYAYERGCLDFYAGGALGFDTCAAKEVIKFRLTHKNVRLVLILPHVGQSDNWTQRQRVLYDYIRQCADEVIYIADEYYDGCLKERNLRLVENADILIAYSGRTNSGAAQTVRMAQKLGIDVYNLYPTLEQN